MHPICRLVLIAEDLLSEIVAKKILAESENKFEVVNSLTWNKDEIKNRIGGINKSAKSQVFFVLTDQDTQDNCPPLAIKELPGPLHHNLLYRFAVMEIESWVMAHRKAISEFLFVPLNKIPQNTDTLPKPKETLISLARKSRSRTIRNDIVPRDNSTSKVGPNYNGKLAEFVENYWDVNIASLSSPSLKRTFFKLNSYEVLPINSA